MTDARRGAEQRQIKVITQGCTVHVFIPYGDGATAGSIGFEHAVNSRNLVQGVAQEARAALNAIAPGCVEMPEGWPEPPKLTDTVTFTAIGGLIERVEATERRLARLESKNEQNGYMPANASTYGLDANNLFAPNVASFPANCNPGDPWKSAVVSEEITADEARARYRHLAKNVNPDPIQPSAVFVPGKGIVHKSAAEIAVEIAENELGWSNAIEDGAETNGFAERCKRLVADYRATKQREGK